MKNASFIVIVYLGITSAAVEPQPGDVNERNNVRKDFRNLLETVARNGRDIRTLRRFLEKDTAQDHEAFETLKNSLRMRAARYPRREDIAINKRQAEDVSHNAAGDSTTEYEETTPSSTDIATETTSLSTDLTDLTEETTSYSTVMPEELISKFDEFYETVQDIKFDPRLSQWRSTTNSTDSLTTSSPKEKKKVSRRARASSKSVQSKQPNGATLSEVQSKQQNGTTLSEAKEDPEGSTTTNLPEDTAPHLYDRPYPWTGSPRVKVFTGVYTPDKEHAQKQPFNNYTPPFNNEHYSNYQRMFHRPSALTQTQSYTYPPNYHSQPPPPLPRNWPQQPNQWHQSQNQQPPDNFWEQPAPQQGAQHDSYYGPRQGPYPAPPPPPPPQYPQSPQYPGQPPYPMQDRQFDQQYGMNEKFPRDARHEQDQFRQFRRNYRRHYPDQDFDSERNDTGTNFTRSGYRRRPFHQRRSYPRQHRNQQGEPYWPSQYQAGAPPPLMQPPPPSPPPPYYHYQQQMYPPPPPRNWPNTPHYPQQPNNNAQRGYQQPPPQNVNWQSNPNWQSGQNQAPYVTDMSSFNYPPMDPRENQQMRTRNNRHSPPSQSPPPPPPPPPQ